MKSPLFIVLFIVSLAANSALGLYFLKRPAPATAPATAQAKAAKDGTLNPDGTNANNNQTESNSAKSRHAIGSIQWQAPQTEADLHSLVANLRSAGFPPATIRAIISQLLQERFSTKKTDADQPFWKRSSQTPEQVAARQALHTQSTALFESLLGPDALPSAIIDPKDRAKQFGNLSDDKLNAIIRIERDYSEIGSAAYSTRDKSAANQGTDLVEQQRVMQKEKLADLASVLSPDELAQYEMRNSTTAHRLMSNLGAVDINEAEYVNLYQAQKKYDDTTLSLLGTSSGSSAIETMAQRSAAQQALNNQVQSVLGDDRFFKYLESTDPNYARTAQFTAQYPNLTPAVSYQLYQLQNELQSSMMALSRNRSTADPHQRVLDMQTSMAGYETQLQTLLGPDAAAEYKKTSSGRLFGTMVNALNRLPRTGN